MPIQLPKMNPCVVCELVVNRSRGFAEVERNELTIAYVPDRQFEEGQLLVSPLRHAPTLLDLTDDEASAVIAHARSMARALVAAYDPDGITLYQNNGVVSRQEVPHFHQHVVPRRVGSNWGEGPPHIAAIEHANDGQVDELPARVAASVNIPMEHISATADRIRAAISRRARVAKPPASLRGEDYGSHTDEGLGLRG